MQLSAACCRRFRGCGFCEIARDSISALCVQVGVSFVVRNHAHKHVVPHWLIHLGAIGVFAVSVVDSSIIPLPVPGSTDLLVLVLAANQGNPWLLAAAAVSGSLIGGYLTWTAGKKGGESVLQRYVPRRLLKPVSSWVKGHGVVAVSLASILPPPIPLMPFLLSAGALGVSRNSFLVSFGIARTVRYGFLAWLGVAYGRRVIRAWTQYMAGWSVPIIWTFIALLVAAAIFGVWKFRRDQRRQASGRPARAIS
jgi:membrane protein YqaA with SNARE-associated domain